MVLTGKVHAWGPASQVDASGKGNRPASLFQVLTDHLTLINRQRNKMGGKRLESQSWRFCLQGMNAHSERMSDAIPGLSQKTRAPGVCQVEGGNIPSSEIQPCPGYHPDPGFVKSQACAHPVPSWGRWALGVRLLPPLRRISAFAPGHIAGGPFVAWCFARRLS